MTTKDNSYETIDDKLISKEIQYTNKQVENLEKEKYDLINTLEEANHNYILKKTEYERLEKKYDHILSEFEKHKLKYDEDRKILKLKVNSQLLLTDYFIDYSNYLSKFISEFNIAINNNFHNYKNFKNTIAQIKQPVLKNIKITDIASKYQKNIKNLNNIQNSISEIVNYDFEKYNNIEDKINKNTYNKTFRNKNLSTINHSYIPEEINFNMDNEFSELDINHDSSCIINEEVINNKISLKDILRLSVSKSDHDYKDLITKLDILITNIKDITIFKNIIIDINNLIKNINNNISKENEDIKSKINCLLKDIEKSNDDIIIFENNIKYLDDLNNELNYLEGKEEESKSKLLTQTENINALLTKKNKIIQEIDISKLELHKMKENTLLLKEDINALILKEDNIKKEIDTEDLLMAKYLNEISKCNIKINELNTKLNKLRNDNSDENEELLNLNTQIQKLQSEINVYDNNQLSIEIDDKINILNNLKKEIMENKKEENKLKNKINDIDEQLEYYQEELKNIKNNININNNIIDDREKSIKSYKLEINNLKESAIDNEKYLLNSGINKSDIFELLIILNKIKELPEIISTDNNIKDIIIKLNKEINILSTKIEEKNKYIIKSEIEIETKKETIKQLKEELEDIEKKSVYTNNIEINNNLDQNFNEIFNKLNNIKNIKVNLSNKKELISGFKVKIEEINKILDDQLEEKLSIMESKSIISKETNSIFNQINNKFDELKSINNDDINDGITFQSTRNINSNNTPKTAKNYNHHKRASNFINNNASKNNINYNSNNNNINSYKNHNNINFLTGKSSSKYNTTDRLFTKKNERKTYNHRNLIPNINRNLENNDNFNFFQKKKISEDYELENNKSIMDIKLLEINWQDFIKDIIKLSSYILKSSSIMANNVSLIISKTMIQDKNYQQIKKVIIKFLNESFERHKQFLNKTYTYKNSKDKTVAVLKECLLKVSEIGVTESKAQEKITEDIKIFFQK